MFGALANHDQPDMVAAVLANNTRRVMVGQPLDALRRPLTASQANRVYGQEVTRPQLSVHAEVDAHDLTAALIAWLPTSPKPTSEPALKLDDVAAPPRPNLYCRSGTLGGATLATANLTVWEAALQCRSMRFFQPSINFSCV